MENLKINIIPFQHPSLKKEFGFYKEKKEGYYPIHRTELPNELWDTQKEEIVKSKYYYTNFIDTIDCDFKTKVDFAYNAKFAKHYYTHSAYKHFANISDAIQLNYVKDIEVWFLDTALSTKEYNN